MCALCKAIKAAVPVCTPNKGFVHNCTAKHNDHNIWSAKKAHVNVCTGKKGKKKCEQLNTFVFNCTSWSVTLNTRRVMERSNM